MYYVHLTSGSMTILLLLKLILFFFFERPCIDKKMFIEQQLSSTFRTDLRLSSIYFFPCCEETF